MSAGQAYVELLERIKSMLLRALGRLGQRNAPLSFPGVGTARLIPWKNELHLAWPLVLGFSEREGGLGVQWLVYLLADGTLIRSRFNLPPYAEVYVEEVVCPRVLSSLTVIALSRGSSHHLKR